MPATTPTQTTIATIIERCLDVSGHLLFASPPSSPIVAAFPLWLQAVHLFSFGYSLSQETRWASRREKTMGCGSPPLCSVTFATSGATMHSEKTSHGLQADFEDIRRCQSGDGEAYRRLVERHQQRVAAIMWRFSRDPDTHEDLVQDVFLEAYESLSGYRGKAPFSHWLARIATRVGYRHWKREKRERATAAAPLQEWHQVAEDSVAETSPQQAAEIVHRLLQQLPPRDRLVLTVRYLEGHTVEKTSELTGWSQTMVKVQTWRARKKLRRLLEKAREEAGV